MNWFQPSQIDADDDLKIELLFEDPLVVTCGPHNAWARRRRINLAELVHEPWIMQARNTWNHSRLSEAFQARGLAMPGASLVTHSLLLDVHFLTNGPYVTAYPRFAAQRSGLKILPVDLELRPWPVIVTTLRHRTMSPVVERFIECAREVTSRLLGGQKETWRTRGSPMSLKGQIRPSASVEPYASFTPHQQTSPRQSTRRTRADGCGCQIAFGWKIRG